MKQTVTSSGFHDAFDNMGRGGQFTYEALDQLFDYFEQYESDTGEELELDVIAICCDYSEDDYHDIADYYNIDLEDAEGDEADEIELVIEFLQNEGVFIGATEDNKILYQQF